MTGETSHIILGGKEGWSELSRTDGITTGKGRFGYSCLQLATDSPRITDSTDLMLHFEQDPMGDASGNYTVVKNSFVKTSQTPMGKYAALSSGNGNGMVLRGKKGTVFGTGGRIGSFSIDFWIAPSIAENGETVFSWLSSRNVGGYSMYQMITVSFFNNHLEWKFSNVFDGYVKSDGDVILEGSRPVIPDVWSHHRLSFDEATGLMEYRVDGISESLLYITPSGHEEGTVYQPILGVPADIELCPRYTGRIDDFCISKDVTPDTDTDLQYTLYRRSGGRFESNPIPVGPGAVLNSVEAVMDIPEQTDVRLYVRSGDNFFNWTESAPEWIPVKAGKPVRSVTGGFFQIAGDLFPDGDGKKTPSITRISLNYAKQPLPLPPFTVKAVAGDGSVTLNWSYSVDDTAGGYYIYYGERPGEYLGRAATEGPSPVNAGNTAALTLTGLKNGTIYYFAIASWSRFDSAVTGPLSKEVYARPYGE